jgi:hypothetical protein
MKRFVNAIEQGLRRVSAGRQLRRRDCQWPGCDVQVQSRERPFCTAHWYKLPGGLRHRLWRACRFEADRDHRPSAAYLAVFGEAQAWIADHLARRGAPPADRRQPELDL